MPTALDAIVPELSAGRSSGADRDPDQLRRGICRRFPSVSPSTRTRRIVWRNCQSPVFLFVELEADRVAIHADAPIEAPRFAASSRSWWRA